MSATKLSPTVIRCQKIIRDLSRLQIQLNVVDDRIAKAEEKRQEILRKMRFKVDESNRYIKSKCALP